jgi:hypothetical protein
MKLRRPRYSILLSFNLTLLAFFYAVFNSFFTFFRCFPVLLFPLCFCAVLYSLLLTHYCSGDKIEKNEMDRLCSSYCRGERRVQDLGGPEGKRQLREARRRWEDNIKIDLNEVKCGRMNWIELAQDRDMWRAVINGNEPSGCIKFW